MYWSIKVLQMYGIKWRNVHHKISAQKRKRFSLVGVRKMYVHAYGFRRKLLFDKTIKFTNKFFEIGVSKKTGLISSIKTTSIDNLIAKKYGFAYNEYYDLSERKYFDQVHAFDVKTYVSSRTRSSSYIVATGLLGSKYGNKGRLFFLNEYILDKVKPKFSIKIERLYLDSVEAVDASICFIFTRNPDWIEKYKIGDRETFCERIVNPPQTNVCASMGGNSTFVKVCPTFIQPNSGQLRCTPPRTEYKEIEYDWRPDGGKIRRGTKQIFYATIEVLTLSE